MKTLNSFVLLFLIYAFAAIDLYAQEERRAAWQATRYDLTVNSTSLTIDRALVVRAVLAARNVGQGGGRTMTVRLNTAAEVRAASVANATATFRSRIDERNKLQQLTISLPAEIAPNQSVSVTLDYRLPVKENSGLAAISPEGMQFLPLSFWYPTPNTLFSLRGVDTAPFHITVNGVSGASVVSAGQVSGTTVEQPLNAQPFFLTGKWDTVEGTGEARGVSVWLPAGASADERKQGEVLVGLAAAARSFYAAALGAPPEIPIKLVTVLRRAGFSEAGTVLLDTAIVRRSKVD